MSTPLTPLSDKPSQANLCEVCGSHVSRAGEFDTYMCWLHWHAVMMMRGVDIVEVDGYVELHEQPWYQSEVHVRGE